MGKSKFHSGDLRLILEVGMTKNYYYAPTSIEPMLPHVFQLMEGEASTRGGEENNKIITLQSLKGMNLSRGPSPKYKSCCQRRLIPSRMTVAKNLFCSTFSLVGLQVGSA